MGRPGITYQDVVNAANQLLGQGKSPTIEHIRAFLGTGSSTTINNHLRTWKLEQGESQQLAMKEHLPAEWVFLMKGLWEKLVTQSEEQVTSIENNYQKTLTDISQELEKYKTNNHRWQQLYNQWLKEKENHVQEKISLEKQHIELQLSHTALITKYELAQQESQNKDLRLDELHQLYKQLQINHEQDRKLFHDQQKETVASFEKQSNELKTQCNENQILQQQLQVLQQALSAAKHELEKLQNQHHSEQKNYSIKLAEWQTKCEKFQERLLEETKKCMELKAERDMLAKECQSNHASAENFREQNIILFQEKLSLLHEKATLEERLRLHLSLKKEITEETCE